MTNHPEIRDEVVDENRATDAALAITSKLAYLRAGEFSSRVMTQAEIRSIASDLLALANGASGVAE